MGVAASPHPLFKLLVAAGIVVMGGCSGGNDASEATLANDDGSTDNGADSDDNETDDATQLAHYVTCSVELDAVANLPAIDTEQAVVDETPTPGDEEEEHAELASLYRTQAQGLAETLGRSSADLTAMFTQAKQTLDVQRKAQAPKDFAVWVAGEADDCPPI
jgi:hypothetical protein